MLAETAARVSDPDQFLSPIIVGSERHGAVLRRQVSGATVILEPVGRNSAPAIAAASLIAGEDDILAVLPSDHHITDEAGFRAVMRAALPAAERGEIVTFGIEPTFPATGYGYILAGKADPGSAVVRVTRFVEKPDRETAQGYINQGGCFWNAGIFLFSVRTMLAAFKAHAADILESVEAALPSDRGQIIVLDRAGLERTRSESIDYAVMEHADNVSVAPVSMGWSDLGDHKALFELKSNGGSVLEGPVVSDAARNCFVRSHGPRIAVKDIENLAVIASPDGVLVTPVDKAPSIKSLVQEMDAGVYANQVSPSLRETTSHWLFRQCLPVWAKNAWDSGAGGFFETLDFGGTPRRELPRRGRIAPRQTFSFARAIRLGWDDDGAASHLVTQGLAFLSEQGRSPRGGWAHLMSPSGAVMDERRSLYDHAFVLLAASEAFAATDQPSAKALGEEAFEFIETNFRDASGAGYDDPDVSPDRKLANPHMHLLEAFTAWFEASGDAKALDRASEIAMLFERHFFDPQFDAVREVMDERFQPVAAENFIEPGHCSEWAYLLHRLDRHTDRDTESWQRRLIRFGENRGVDATSGFFSQRLTAQSEPLDASRRLWPQLERFRAALHRPDAVPVGMAENCLDAIWREYFRSGQDWFWIDWINADGSQRSDDVPASMLYHLMTALSPIAVQAETAPPKGL